MDLSGARDGSVGQEKAIIACILFQTYRKEECQGDDSKDFTEFRLRCLNSNNSHRGLTRRTHRITNHVVSFCGLLNLASGPGVREGRLSLVRIRAVSRRLEAGGARLGVNPLIRHLRHHEGEAFGPRWLRQSDMYDRCWRQSRMFS